MSQFDELVQLRPALSRPLQEASADEIRAELAAEGIDADAAEDFLSSISAIGRAVAPHLSGIASGALSGASAGMAAGPIGALIGALGGGLAGGLSSPASPAGAGAPGAHVGAAGPGLGAGAGGAAGSLLGLLSQPQVMQGLMSMLMGNAGSKTVPVAGQQVPPSAIANAVAEYASQAAAEWEERYGVPAAPTLLGLSEDADEAQRAFALAQAMAIESLVRSIHAEANSDEASSDEASYDEADYTDADYFEGDYSEADYAPTYDRVYQG